MEHTFAKQHEIKVLSEPDQPLNVRVFHLYKIPNYYPTGECLVTLIAMAIAIEPQQLSYFLKAEGKNRSEFSI